MPFRSGDDRRRAVSPDTDGDRTRGRGRGRRTGSGGDRIECRRPCGADLCFKLRPLRNVPRGTARPLPAGDHGEPGRHPHGRNDAAAQERPTYPSPFRGRRLCRIRGDLAGRTGQDRPGVILRTGGAFRLRGDHRGRLGGQHRQARAGSIRRHNRSGRRRPERAARGHRIGGQADCCGRHK